VTFARPSRPSPPTFVSAGPRAGRLSTSAKPSTSSSKHIQDHGPTLWRHVITPPEQAGGGIRVVDRTNCRLESLNGNIKHGERRRSSRKKLTQDLENLPPGEPLLPSTCTTPTA
jgi:hypothetical protein